MLYIVVDAGGDIVDFAIRFQVYLLLCDNYYF